MPRNKVYIDGQAGTTGLQIQERLAGRTDIELLLIDEDKRHDVTERARLMNEADLVFLCLPDAAAVEAVELVNNPDTVIIDCSTAHRTAWTYGFAELDADHKQAIQQSKRIANPGCHASGFISLVYPLVKSGLLKDDAQLTCFSLTGYTGGGKKMIADYEGETKKDNLAPKLYGLSLKHKHLPEMTKITGLKKAPLFVPIVDDYPRGMLTSVTIAPDMLSRPLDKAGLLQFYRDWYQDGALVSVAENKESQLPANRMEGLDALEITVSGDEAFLVSATFDNLGKGASGAAIQNMNLVFGLDETAGLERK